MFSYFERKPNELYVFYRFAIMHLFWWLSEYE